MSKINLMLKNGEEISVFSAQAEELLAGLSVAGNFFSFGKTCLINKDSLIAAMIEETEENSKKTEILKLNEPKRKN